MINVTNDIKQAYDLSTTQVDKIVLEGKEYRISNVEYYDNCYNEGNIFGTAIARCLDFEIENTIDLEGKEVRYYTGIIINGTIKWIELGNFIVQSVESNDTTVINKVTAMDYMLKTNIEYVSSLNYGSGNITLLDVLEEACEKSGVILATSHFVNCDFIVDSNQFKQGSLIRQVIQSVALISGSIAKIKNDNKLYLINPNQISTVSKIFTLNNYEEAEIKRATHPINVVSLAMKDVEGENITLRDEESIAEDGENVLLINDNPFAYTQAKREQLITALFNAVKGFEYKAYSFKAQGLPYLETMDKIQFKDKAGNIYNSYVFRFNYKSPNGLESEIEAPSIIKAAVNYQNVPDALDIAKRTEIKVDKQEQTITETVEKIEKNSEKMSQILQTVDEITQKVENIADLTNTLCGIKKITLDNAVVGSPIEIRILGNNVVFKQLTLSDDLYLSDNTVLGGDSDLKINDNVYSLGINEVLRQYEGVYDEYVYNYTEDTAKVIRRIGVNNAGELYVLTKELIENLSVPDFILKDGENTITIPNYSANMCVTYVVKNDYTNVFATKVEMKSNIEQSATRIEDTVSEKYTTKDETKELSTTFTRKADSIEAKLHDKELTSEAIIGLINNRDGTSTAKISATNVELNGVVTASDLKQTGKTVINGANITTGTISSDRLDTENLRIGGSNATTEISAKTIGWLAGNVPSPSRTKF